MHKVRITIRRNPDDPLDDLRCASRLRRDLWSHSPVEIVPDGSTHATQRDGDGNAFIEFVTDYLDEVNRVRNDYGYADRTDIAEEYLGEGSECVNCGNVPNQPVAVCPVCGFQDIEPCPYCETEVARLDYIPISGGLFKCPIPNCGRRVRLRLNDIIDTNGQIGQPLVHVSPAEAPVEHDV
jgi:hypothetical protein